MTIEDNTQSAQFTGSGTTGPFPCTFKILSTDQIRVFKRLIASPYTETELTLTTDYTVEITGPDSFDVETVDTVSSSYYLIVVRSMDFTQETSFRTQGQQNAASWENAFDNDMMCSLQLKRDQDGMVKLPTSENPDNFDMELPLSELRANKALWFDASGNVTVATSTSQEIPDSSLTQVVDTIAALKALAVPSSAVTYVVRGYYAAGDGGGGTFYWSSGSSATDNGGTIVSLDLGGTGRFLRIYETGWVNVKWFGATGDGTTDDAADITSAIDVLTSGGTVFMPRGTYLIGSQIAVDTMVTLRGEGKAATIIKKGANGAMLTLASYSGIVDLKLNGNYPTYTGRGVLISSGFGQFIDDCVLTSFLGSSGAYCVEYTAADAGSQSFIINSELATTTAFNVAVKYPNTADSGACPRSIINCQGSGSILVDFGAALDPYFAFNFTNGLTFSQTTCSNVMISGCRIATAGATTTIKGGSVHISNCVFAGPVVFHSSTSSCVLDSSTVTDNDITNAGTGNQISAGARTYTTAWTSTGVAPALGNATANSAYQRSGNLITAMVDITFGGTSTYGTGAWRFSLPEIGVNANPVHAGYGYVACNGVNRVAVPVVLPGTNTVQLLVGNATGVMSPANASWPDTWATGDIVRITVPYRAV